MKVYVVNVQFPGSTSLPIKGIEIPHGLWESLMHLESHNMLKLIEYAKKLVEEQKLYHSLIKESRKRKRKRKRKKLENTNDNH